MAQQRIADAAVQELLAVGPFLGIDASTSKYFLDQFHANDSIAVVPNRAFRGYVTARGRAHALSAAYASQLYGLTKFQRASLPDLYVAAVNSGGAGVLQTSQLGGTPSTLSLPISLGQSLETSFVPYQQWLFETDGVDTPLKIDTNLNVTQWQIKPPVISPTIQSFDGPGSDSAPDPNLQFVTGTSPGTAVHVVETFVINGIESNQQPFAGVLTPSTTQQVQVVSPVQSNYSDLAGVTGVSFNVYASTNVNGPFYLQNTTPIALGTNFTIPGTLLTTTKQSPGTWTGNLRGTYYYLVTFANGFQESSGGPVSAGVFITNNVNDINPNGGVINPGPALLTNIPVSPDPQCTGRNVYRFGGTMQEIMLVGTINDNTTTTWVDNTADSAVTGQTLVQHRDPPQPFYAIAAHKGRVWGFGYNGTAVGEPSTIQGTSDLWYTNYEEPWAFNNVSQVIPIGRNTGGDIAVELKDLGSLLCCLKSKSFWVVYGDTPQDFVQRQLEPIGCGSKKSVVAAYGRLFWLSDEGAVYMFDGLNFTNISDNRSTGANSSIKVILDGFTKTDFAAAAGAAYDNTYLISFPTQSITFMYDIPTGQWFKLPWAFDRATFDLENQNEIQASEVGSGTLDTWFAAETDLGSAITSSYVSRQTDSGSPQATKRYRYAVVLAPVQTGATATVTTTVYAVNGQIVNTKTVDLSTGGRSHRLSLPPNMVGSEVQITLAVTSSVETQIHRASILGWIERQLTSQG